MSELKLLPHQAQALDETKSFNRVAFYHDMGLGKTFTGGEKLRIFNNEYNLLICQKSKVDDWVKHFKEFYPQLNVIDYTKSKAAIDKGVIVINYDLVWRRPELLSLRNFTLMLDESSLIQNEGAKRSKFILKTSPKNVILLSGTPTAGKYEKLWSQCRLLGWMISKREFYNRYIIEHEINIKTSQFPIKIVVGYKNVEHLKFMLRRCGAHFLKSEDVLSLPEQTFVNVEVDTIPAYGKFQKDKVVTVENQTLVGDTTFTRLLYERMLCGQYNKNKLQAFSDLIDSTDDRLIVFYNYNAELEQLQKLVKNRPISMINGSVKDVNNYNKYDNTITFCQYQAAAMGHNLQLANKIIYFSLPLSSELFEQSKKRTHRIGQTKSCFYYVMLCKNSVEEKILETLKKRQDYTERLFINN